ncbi:MAG: hypothetical protein QX199_20745 [Methylococcaceae bacterium]
MPSFLLDISYNLETTLLAVAVSFVLAAGLIWLIMAAVCRSRLTQLRMTLEKEITTSEQQRTQLSTDLNNLQQKAQQTELNIIGQAAQIAQLEKDKQTAEIEVKRALALKSSISQHNQKLIELNRCLEEDFQLESIDIQPVANSTQSELFWQKHYQVISQLSQRLHEAEKARTELQQEQQSRQGNLAEKDAAVSALTAAANEQTERAGQLEQALQEQQIQFTQQQQHWQSSLTEKDAALSTLTVIANERAERVGQLEQSLQEQQIQLTQEQQNWQSSLTEQNAVVSSLTATANEQAERVRQLEQTLQEQQIQLTQEQQFKVEQQQQLDHAALQLQQLKHQLAEQAAQPIDILEQQHPGMEFQENYQALEKKLADSESVIKELQAELIATQTGPVTVDPDLIKKLANQEAAIAELNETLAGQANHLFRLEYDLEVKNSIIRDHDSPLQGIPATIVAKQEQAQARIAELERMLNPQQKVAENTLGKTQSKPLELFNPAKQKIEEITDAAKHFPGQFKGFYQKMLSKSQ